MVFPVVMYGCWELDYKEGWTSKNWCLQTMVLEKTLESPLDSKEIKLVNRKGNQPSIFIGRTDAEIEAPIIWPFDANSWLTEKVHDPGKDWGQEEKWVTEDDMVKWHYQLNDMSLKKLSDIGKDRESWHAAVHGVAKSQTWLSDWTTMITKGVEAI